MVVLAVLLRVLEKLDLMKLRNNFVDHGLQETFNWGNLIELVAIFAFVRQDLHLDCTIVRIVEAVIVSLVGR